MVHTSFSLQISSQDIQINKLSLIDISIYVIYRMIRNFANKTAQDVYHGINSSNARKLPRELHGKTQRLLDQINAAKSLHILRIPPGNRLEKLIGELQGFWSLRINDRYRIIFRWDGNDALDVKIIDYH